MISIARGELRFSDLPYMSSAERTEFATLRKSGAVTVFGVAECAAERCENEVPRGAKLYCSPECWQKEEGQADEKEEEASRQVDR